MVAVLPIERMRRMTKWESALRPKRCRLALHPRLREVVASKLILDWSPEQISGWLKTQYPDGEGMRVSHETIYRSLFIQARGVLKKELMDHLRSKRSMRRSRHATVSGQSRGQIVDAISIRERPAEAEDRAIPGHWEGDLLSGAKNSYIATLVERHSRFAMLISDLPGLTSDNGVHHGRGFDLSVLMISTFVTILTPGGYCLKTTGGPLTRFPLRLTVTSTRFAILTRGIPLFIP